MTCLTSQSSIEPSENWKSYLWTVDNSADTNLTKASSAEIFGKKHATSASIRRWNDNIRIAPPMSEGIHRRDGFLGCSQGRHAYEKGARSTLH